MAGPGRLRCGWAAQHQLRLAGPQVRTGSGWHHYLVASGSGNRAGLRPFTIDLPDLP
jgi:hypothetical protein